MARPGRSFVVYVDDSGNQDAGLLWTALAIPLEMWSEYPGRWQAALALGGDGRVLPILARDKAARKLRFQFFEKGMKTIGTFTEARVLTTYKPGRKGKVGLYADLLCFLEEFLERERAYAVVMVDGGHDSGGNLHKCHRALEIKTRRIVEDAGLRRSHESHLLQMVDWCAYSAFQAIQDRGNLKPTFKETYERELDRLIVRPFEVDDGLCIRGFDWEPAAISF